MSRVGGAHFPPAKRIKLKACLRSVVNVPPGVDCKALDLVPLLETKGLVETVNTFEVKVQTISGTNFQIKLDSTFSRVHCLKTQLECIEGTRTGNQQLFLLQSKPDEDGTETFQCPVQDSDNVEPGAVYLLLCGNSRKFDNGTAGLNFNLDNSGSTATFKPPFRRTTALVGGAILPGTGSHSISFHVKMNHKDQAAPAIVTTYFGLVTSNYLTVALSEEPPWGKRGSSCRDIRMDVCTVSSAGSAFIHGKPVQKHRHAEWETEKQV
jgi:hypothetical protein